MLFLFSNRTVNMATKPKKMKPLPVVSATARARQFPNDFYADRSAMFCKYYSHSVDYSRIDTVKDHMIVKNM